MPYKVAQDALAKSIRTGKSLSEAAKLSAFIESQTIDTGRNPILDGRPFKNTRIFTQLHYNALEIFTDGISGNESLNPLVCAETERFLESA